MKPNTFYLIIFSLVFLVISPTFFTQGMFMDGLWYANISKNLSANVGSYWDLYFTNTLFSHFREHPPLAIWLQSFLFRFLGNYFFLDRLYGLLVISISCILIVQIWKAVTQEAEKKISWLPLFFFFCFPTTIWAISNNILESTMMVFTLLSVLFLLYFFKNQKKIYLISAAFFLFLAFLSKGIVGLYILTMPIIYEVVNKKKAIKKGIYDTLTFFFFFCVFIAILFFTSQDSYTFFKEYFYKQIVTSLKSVVTVTTSFYIVYKLFTELIPSLLVVALLTSIRKERNVLKQFNIWATIFLLVGLAGVLPIMISLKQRGFYIFTTFPLFSIAIALIVKQPVSALLNQIANKTKFIFYSRVTSVTLLIAGVSICYITKDKFGRDEELLSDVAFIKKIVPPNTNICINRNLFENWLLHGYLHRYAGISLDTNIVSSCQYFLISKNDTASFIQQKNNTSIYKLNNFCLIAKNTNK